MPVSESSGWLLSRMVEQELLVHHDPKRMGELQMGFGLDDPDYDPAFDAAVDPPAGWDRLPVHEEVSDG